MAVENIGNVYPTKIPGYDDAADIQAALRLYHYGSTEYDINNTDLNQLVNPSIAYTLNDLQSQIDDNASNPAAAANVQDSEPISPVDGFLWVDSDATLTGSPMSATSVYQNTEPSTNLVDGLIWAKKGTSPLEMYVYEESSNTWNQAASDLPSQTGNAGKYLTTNGTTASWASAGINWTQRRDADGNDYKLARYNGSNLYVVAGSAGKLATSSDGITWTDRTSGFGTNTIQSVAFGNGLWVAVGQNGTLTTSSDGVTWTARTSNMGTNTIYGVAYANSTWIAVGTGGGATNTGGIIYSTDGITWTRKSQTITSGTEYYGVVWNGTNWIVITDYSTNNYIYASTPSGTWTAGNAGSSTFTYAKIFYDGTRTYMLRNNGSPWFSTSSTFGAGTQLQGITIQADVAGNQLTWYYDSKFFALGTALVTVSSVPNASNYGNGMYNLGYSPSTTMNNAGATSNNATAFWAGTTGYLVVGASGRIWTSF